MRDASFPAREELCRQLRVSSSVSAPPGHPATLSSRVLVSVFVPVESPHVVEHSTAPERYHSPVQSPVDARRRHDTVRQYGSQRPSDPSYRSVIELLGSGTIGRLRGVTCRVDNIKSRGRDEQVAESGPAPRCPRPGSRPAMRAEGGSSIRRAFCGGGHGGGDGLRDPFPSTQPVEIGSVYGLSGSWCELDSLLASRDRLGAVASLMKSPGKGPTDGPILGCEPDSRSSQPQGELDVRVLLRPVRVHEWPGAFVELTGCWIAA